MARASKKDFIVETAIGVFLDNGYKGTSIDMVVAACQVSKPTVYNHFPDKSELMAAVMDRWLAEHPLVPVAPKTEREYWEALAQQWWSPQALAMYRLVIGEGWRFEAAAQRFWQEFDLPWREQALAAYERQSQPGLDREALDAGISHRLWLALTSGGR